MENTALFALNHLEDGGRVLVTMPGALSSVFYMENGRIYSENAAIGKCEHESKCKIYAHFAAMIHAGGELLNI